MSDFVQFRQLMQNNFEEKARTERLFMTDVDKDEMYNLYLDSFPAGTNEIYRKRREFDCSCCRSFIREIGGAVWFDDNYEPHTIWEFDTHSPDKYQPVCDAMDAYVKRHSVTSVYYYRYGGTVGTDKSRELSEDGHVKEWNHFDLHLFPQHVKSRGTAGNLDISEYNSGVNVLKNSLMLIDIQAVTDVLDMIKDNTLYRGAEWKQPLEYFWNLMKNWDELQTTHHSTNFCWKNYGVVGPVVARIKNHSIGQLLQDLSDGMEVERAVRRYEQIVAPTNYKRPKAIFTQRMLDNAKKEIEEMGYKDSLARAYIRPMDILPENVLFMNRDSGESSGDVFEQMSKEVALNPARFNRATEVPVEKFIHDILPGIQEMSVLVENRHEPNFVSLIGPKNPWAESMFKWTNGVGWAYEGNIADSDIRENVAKAGGRVDGVLRFSIQWNDGKEWDQNDLDAHCIIVDRIEANGPIHGSYIFFGRKRDKSYGTGGNLDIDIINPDNGVPAVENITFPDKKRLPATMYLFYVVCYTNRGGRSGFRAEIEVEGEVHRFNYTKPLRTGENVNVAKVILRNDGTWAFEEMLPSDLSSRKVWGVNTQTFVPVSMLMYSPNYWEGEKGVGNKHYFFMLKDCKNPGTPNGFYNEFLKEELHDHRRVFEALGNRMAVEPEENQLSGLGFCATRKNSVIVKFKKEDGEKVVKVVF